MDFKETAGRRGKEDPKAMQAFKAIEGIRVYKVKLVNKDFKAIAEI